MSESGKDYRITLDRRVKEKLERSHLCWRCGSRVWNTDEKCFRCDAENESYRDSDEVER